MAKKASTGKKPVRSAVAPEKSQKPKRRKRVPFVPAARWVKWVFVTASVLAFLTLAASLSEKPGASEALAGFLLPAPLYLIALLGLRHRSQREAALVSSTLAAACWGAVLDAVFPGVGWRLLAIPLAVHLLHWAWSLVPRRGDDSDGWWAVFGAVLFGGGLLVYVFSLA